MTRTPKTRVLRSRNAMATLTGAAVVLAGCAEETRDVTFFESEAQCVSAASFNDGFTEADCAQAFAEVGREHALTAPRYDSRAVCEEQHGPGACGTEAAALAQAEVDPTADVQTAGGGSVFMPFLAGYMMGSLLSGPGYAGAKPLYPGRDGALRSASGARFPFAGAGSTVRAPATALAPTSRSRPAAPMSRATVAQRGGFGAARTSSGGMRFGG